VPARYLLDVLRGILLKGSDLSAYWQSMAMIILFAFSTMFFAIKRMKKTV
jgi:hypothetical protein